MTILTYALSTAALALGGGAAALALGAARDARAERALWRALAATAEPDPPRFDPEMVAALPEPARRYLTHAIAPGAALHRVAALEMEGSFLLGGRPLPMRARQILAPPAGFVWITRIGAGALRFSGSDAFRAGAENWTRFRLHGLAPLVRAGGPDHARAAAARVAIEAIWAPAAFLPRNGAVWRAAGPDAAEVAFPALPEIAPVRLTLDAAGRLLDVVTERWTDANPERRFRRQPFGGRMLAEAARDGFTIPVEVEVANLFGTPQAAPFFRARITRLRYGPAAALAPEPGRA